jgi:hypothetical protein
MGFARIGRSKQDAHPSGTLARMQPGGRNRYVHGRFREKEIKSSGPIGAFPPFATMTKTRGIVRPPQDFRRAAPPRMGMKRPSIMAFV